MRILFTITLFLSSALLFLIQPMIAKMILPRFGGSPGVWNTSMVFFQAMLLLGYGYAHLTTKWLGPRKQALAHVLVLLLPLVMLPIALPSGFTPEGSANPAPLVLALLAVVVGLPFFVVSAGAPLLQRWFATSSDPHAHDPYFLYSASNLGSLIALLAYPLVLEPSLRLSGQSRLWSAGYVLLVGLMTVCAIAIWRKGKDANAAEAVEAEGDESITWSQRLRWVLLAFAPSSLMLGVTTYLTSNIAPVPFLWIVPLALYLLTFIIAFAKRQVIPRQMLGRIVPILVTPIALIMVLEATDPMLYLAIAHLTVFFVVALMCHTELAASRPKAQHLTEFYFYMSLGGVLGGSFNALIAPLIFNSFFEYPLVLAFACFLRPKPKKAENEKKRVQFDYLYPITLAILSAGIALICKATMDPSPMRTLVAIGVPLILCFLAADRPVRFAGSLIAVLAMMTAFQISSAGRIIEGRRSFFGVHRIEQSPSTYGWIHQLIHGNTLHGQQALGPAYQRIPMTYYHPSGPIGQVFVAFADTPKLHDVALVGLGVGSLAAYGQKGENFTYFEIDPDVVELAGNPKFFTFLRNCEANLKIDVGDARLELAKKPNAAYDLIVLDAFSSDAIPMHLLTKEACQMYLQKLKPGGVLAYHVTNRYLDLEPVLGKIGMSLGLQMLYQEDPEPSRDEQSYWEGKRASRWLLMARNAADFEPLQKTHRWDAVEPAPDAPLWTDDYSNLISAFKRDRQD